MAVPQIFVEPHHENDDPRGWDSVEIFTGDGHYLRVVGYDETSHSVIVQNSWAGRFRLRLNGTN